MLDLDHFKAVNDSYGHMLGDVVLARVGGIVRQAVRDADAACRVGGEEFAVVLPETAREGGYAVAERIRRRVEHAFRNASVEGHDIPMTVSAGLAIFPDDALHGNELIARADEALYGAKHAGRNRVCVHYREKRRALRFPVKPGTAVRIDSGPESGARALNLSRTGMLLDAGSGLTVAERISLRFERGGALDLADELRLSGHVVRVVADPARPAREQVGVAFDEPMPDEQLTARVSLSRASDRSLRRSHR
jgi:diguanylate cyclase (GGDEF)-like protein